MKFKTRELSLTNMIGFKLDLDPEQDTFDQTLEGMSFFKKHLLANDYYFDGPTYFIYSPFEEEQQITVFTTIGNKVVIRGDNSSGIYFQEHLNLMTDYCYRHYDQEEPIPYQAIEEEIKKAGLKLLRIYHVILDLYGDRVIDLYCEVG